MPPPHEKGASCAGQEGPYAVAAAHLPVLQYFPARGRAEPIRLALAYARQDWLEPPVEPIISRHRLELDAYPFRQLPRFIDERSGGPDIVQSLAILRHVGRRFGLTGGDEAQAAFVDMVVDGVQDLRAKLRVLWYRGGDAAAVERYTSTVLAEEGQLVRLEDYPGPGLACLERLARGVAEDGPWLGGAGPRLTIADLCVFDLVDMHLAAPGVAGAVKQRFPALMAHHRRVAAQPGIREYLASDKRHVHVFGDDWRIAQGLMQAPGA